MQNGNIENKIIAACMVFFCLLMAAMVFLTYRVTGRACRCEQVIPAGIQEIDNALDAISHAKDSVSVHSDTTVLGSYRELLERYGRHPPD
ncbi:hypothetical protein [Dyadobacter sp. 676]|uniref:Uncharacterized protein n=1 Tax=Dyadobacter sp. 676 TaxID=3088362 RepID=A0AAU8FM50_9BACT